MKQKAITWFTIAIAILSIFGISYGRFSDRKLCDDMCHRGQCVCVETCPKERNQ